MGLKNINETTQKNREVLPLSQSLPFCILGKWTTGFNHPLCIKKIVNTKKSLSLQYLYLPPTVRSLVSSTVLLPFSLTVPVTFPRRWIGSRPPSPATPRNQLTESEIKLGQRSAANLIRTGYILYFFTPYRIRGFLEGLVSDLVGPQSNLRN